MSVVALSAWGGSSDKAGASPSSASTFNQAIFSALSHKAKVGVPLPPAPPAGLEVSHLVSSVNLSQAAGATVQGVQNEGGAESSTAAGQKDFTSEVEVQIGGQVMTISLETFASAADATQAYNAVQVSSAGQALPGVGTEASAVGLSSKVSEICPGLAPGSNDTTISTICLKSLAGLLAGTGAVNVLVGAQLLSITPNATSSAPASSQNDQPATTTTTVPSLAAAQTLIQALTEEPVGIAKALVAQMNGQPASGTYYELPPGGIDPCAINPQQLGSSLHVKVTSSFLPGDGDTECQYNLGNNPYWLSFTTRTEAASAVPPINLKSQFANAAQGQTTRQVGPVNGYTEQLFVEGGENFVTGALFSGPSRASTASTQQHSSTVLAALGPPSLPQVIIMAKALEAKSYGEQTTPHDCEDLWKELGPTVIAMQFLGSSSDSEFSQQQARVLELCLAAQLSAS